MGTVEESFGRLAGFVVLPPMKGTLSDWILRVEWFSKSVCAHGPSAGTFFFPIDGSVSSDSHALRTGGVEFEVCVWKPSRSG